MPDPPAAHRFYAELAEWWPLISPPGEYVEEAAFAARLLDSASIPVRFAMTLVDLSEEMPAVSRRLNPSATTGRATCARVRLGRSFDAVFVHDAIDYMTIEDDLGRAIETAFAHCRPGGVDVLVPDDSRETSAFLLREADGTVQIVHETHRIGLFGRDVWLGLLADAGFEPDAVVERITEDRTPRELFVGRRRAP